MSKIYTADTLAVWTMRWIARVLTILWVVPVLYWTGFVRVFYWPERVQFITFIIALPLLVVVALIASFRRKEALGGGLLLAAGLLTIISFTHGPHSPLLIGGRRYLVEGRFLEVFRILKEEPRIYLPFSMMAPPPLVASALFLICHWRSKRSAEQP